MTEKTIDTLKIGIGINAQKITLTITAEEASEILSALFVTEKEKGEVTLDEVCKYCNERNIEMVAKDWLDSLNASLEEAVNISTAFAESMKAFNARLEELEHETELLEADLQDGVRGYGMNRKCFEVRVKKELLRDILCFMTQAIEEAKEGSGE